MTGPVCVFVDDPLPDDLTDPRNELGGKGLSLRRLHAAGVRVPRGFTICAWVCRRFLSSNDWPVGAWPAVESALDRLRRQIADGETGGSAGTDTMSGLRLAVRSGAVVSMPGLLRTLLDVSCVLPAESADAGTGDPCSPVRSAIEEVFRSWSSPAAEQYRRQAAIDGGLATAVTVQEMVPCIASGVMFTRSDDAASDNLAIEAVAGSGASLVSGRATPLRWIVRRHDRQVLESPPTAIEAPEGLDAALPELIATGLRLETELAAPLDIEWGLDRSGLVFFQARPIDANVADDDQNAIRDQQLARLRTLAAAGVRCWVRHNLSETLAHPTPLTWSIWRQFMSVGGGLGTLYRQLGYRPARRGRDESILTLIGGQIYADPDRAVAMFGSAWPWTYDLDRLRKDPSQLDAPPRTFDPQRLDPWFVWRLPALLWRMAYSQRRIRKLIVNAAADFEQQTVPQLVAFVAVEQRMNLGELNEPELLQRFEARRRRVMDEFAPRALLPGTLGGVALAELTRRSSSILGADAAVSLVCDITPAGDVELVRRQRELLARWADPQARSAFFDEFGQRAIGELELAVPRWRETPELIAGFAANRPPSMPEASTAVNETPQERLRRVFAAAGAASLVSEADVWLNSCRQLLPCRDRGRHLWLKGYELLRQVTEELSRRFDLGGDFYFLTAADWADLMAGRDVRPLIDERRREAATFRKWHCPSFIDAARPEELFAAAITHAGEKSLQGTPLSSGYGEGRVWTRGEGDHPPNGFNCVFVCDSLEPSLLPLLAGVVAVVVQQGGLLSHGAILARQMDLPVVRLPDATRRLHDGQRVGVDGQTGRVRILEGATP